jgi:hypothetical protein
MFRNAATLFSTSFVVWAWQWWEGELERVYVLCKARAISENLRQQAAPSAPVSAYLQARVAAGSALPTVEVLGVQKREQEEEERRAVLAFAVTTLGSDLFTELMHGVPAQRGLSARTWDGGA